MRLLRLELRATDFWWAVAAPFYVTIGTIRHEGSHALTAIAQGARILDFSVLPSKVGWGYVNFVGGNPTWLVSAAPYLCDLVTFAIGFALCMRLPPRRRSLFINVAGIGVVSALVNSANAYVGGLRGRGDVAGLLDRVPAPWVHGDFVLTLTTYLIGILVILSRSPMAAGGSDPGNDLAIST